jgi:hypothetical protein
MNPDLPSPDDEPGLDQLFRTLTSGPTNAELSGQDAALTMFRTNIRPSRAAAAGSSARGASARPSSGARSFARGTSRRSFRLSFSPGLALAAAMVVALGGAVAAAAYTDALPAPVQTVVHDAFGFAGVPSKRHHHSSAASKGRGQHQGGSQPGASGGTPSHGSSGKSSPTASRKPGGSPSPSHSPSPSSSPSGAAGATLTASASDSPIAAGGQVVIDGQLTRSGSGVAGLTVKLAEHLAGTPGWRVIASAKTTTSGNVAVTVSALTSNAAFQLRAGDGVHSAVVHVVVTPSVTITLKPGALAVRDLLSVSTLYAHPGNWVELRADEDGVWTTLREKRLNAAGATHFYLSGKNLKGDEVQVVLLATLRHGKSASNQVTVPPPT